jgi:hypothetical protein
MDQTAIHRLRIMQHKGVTFVQWVDENGKALLEKK